MDIWAVYRMIKNTETGKIEKIKVVEYFNNETEARKYSRLFDLQTPSDLKDRVSHKFQNTNVVED